MTRPTRIACATAANGGLALGDPSGVHALLTSQGIEHRGAGVPQAPGFRWADVHDLTLEARGSRARRPGRASVLLGAAAESVGLQWTPGTAPVTVVVHDDEGRHDLTCEGYIGSGYWSPHLEALQAAVHVLVAHPSTRQVLDRPAQALTDLAAAAGTAGVRDRLAGMWGSRCECPGGG